MSYKMTYKQADDILATFHRGKELSEMTSGLRQLTQTDLAKLTPSATTSYLKAITVKRAELQKIKQMAAELIHEANKRASGVTPLPQITADRTRKKVTKGCTGVWIALTQIKKYKPMSKPELLKMTKIPERTLFRHLADLEKAKLIKVTNTKPKMISAIFGKDLDDLQIYFDLTKGDN